MKVQKFISTLIIILLLLAVFNIAALAHSGGTDANGGHYNHSEGGYHYHHGFPEHQHFNGICPYSYNDNSSDDTVSVYEYSYDDSFESYDLDDTLSSFNAAVDDFESYDYPDIYDSDSLHNYSNDDDTDSSDEIEESAENDVAEAITSTIIAVMITIAAIFLIVLLVIWAKSSR